MAECGRGRLCGFCARIVCGWEQLGWFWVYKNEACPLGWNVLVILFFLYKYHSCISPSYRTSTLLFLTRLRHIYTYIYSASRYISTAAHPRPRNKPYTHIHKHQPWPDEPSTSTPSTTPPPKALPASPVAFSHFSRASCERLRPGSPAADRASRRQRLRSRHYKENHALASMRTLTVFSFVFFLFYTPIDIHRR